MWAAVTLGVSLSAIAALLLVRDWELRRRTKLFFELRERSDALIASGASFVATTTPTLGRLLWFRIKVVTKRHATNATHFVVVHLERAVERLLRSLRYQRLKTSPRTPSPFLQDVAEHKKNLDRNGI